MMLDAWALEMLSLFWDRPSLSRVNYFVRSARIMVAQHPVLTWSYISIADFGKVADRQVPDMVTQVDVLPLPGTGKILSNPLHKEYGDVLIVADIAANEVCEARAREIAKAIVEAEISAACWRVKNRFLIDRVWLYLF